MGPVDDAPAVGTQRVVLRDVAGDGDVDGEDFAEFIDLFSAGGLDAYDVAVFASDFNRTNCP